MLNRVDRVTTVGERASFRPAEVTCDSADDPSKPPQSISPSVTVQDQVGIFPY